MLAIHDSAGLRIDPILLARIEALRAAIGTERGIELIRAEIRRGTIRVRPAPGGGLLILPAIALPADPPPPPSPALAAVPAAPPIHRRRAAVGTRGLG